MMNLQHSPPKHSQKRDDKITRSKSKLCDICTGDNANVHDIISCAVCLKSFHLLCVSVTLAQKQYLVNRSVGWSCPSCYFSNLSETKSSLSNLKAAISKIEDGFNVLKDGVTVFKNEISTYNQINDINIAFLMESNGTYKNDITSLNSDVETLKTVTQLKLTSLKDEINDGAVNLACLQQKFDVMEARMQQLLSSQNVGECSSDLNDKLEKIDRFMLSHNLMLINVPMNKSENVADLVHKFLIVIGLPKLTESKYECHRISSKTDAKSNQPPPIVIKFYNRKHSDQVLHSYFSKIKAKSYPDYKSLGLGNSVARIYLNESLSSKALKIFTMARQLKQQPNANIHQVFTSHGNIFIRKSPEGRRIKIGSTDQLQKLNNNLQNNYQRHTNRD